MHEGGITGESFDDNDESEHEDSADTRSGSILALSSFNGSWWIGIFSSCDVLGCLSLLLRFGEALKDGSDEATFRE